MHYERGENVSFKVAFHSIQLYKIEFNQCTTDNIRSQPIPVSIQPPYMESPLITCTGFLVFINTKFQISNQSSYVEEGSVLQSVHNRMRTV